MLLSSFAFDSSIVGLFWTLSQGGTLVLESAETISDPRELAAAFEKQQITHTLALPSLYQQLLTEAEPQQLAALDTVIVAGESCPPFLVYLHQERLPEVALFNEYGPTEGTVWGTVFDCREPFGGSPVPIGRPIQNAEIYILTPDREPVPIGVPGDLYIGGPGVAQGYYKRPGLTAERFVAHPFSEDPAATLYRTGDLARFLPDGNIEFLGRADQQIKIRGYRVELGEVENVLSTNAAVQEAVVITHEDKHGLTQLSAYITTSESTTAQALREFLLQKLPPYMIPANFVFLDKLPRTPNGKVNRRALPDPDGSSSKAAAVYVEPRTALEKVLAGVWGELLNYEPIGINDNFFNLGGHSILVTQLVGRLRSLLPVDLPLRIIFDRPTIAELSDYILEQAEDTAEIETTAELLMQVADLSDAEAEAALAEN
jgi:acyl-coenzyme A synthetase/AMP-(fatty) acid ligase